MPVVAADPPAPRIGHIRVAGILALVALTVTIVLSPSWNQWLSATGFDAFQILSPRQIRTLPVTVVQIDDKSVAALGRWPWPRTLLAQLIDEINRYEPVAIGVDIFMPEADPLSPDRLLERAKGERSGLYAELAALPSNDATLARALAATRSVLPVAGTPDRTGMQVSVVPFTVAQTTVSADPNMSARPGLERFGGAYTSLDTLNRAASGWGLISVDPSAGASRRLSLAAYIGENTLVPAFAVEMLRVALRAPSLRLVVSGTSVDGIAVGKTFIPTEADGSVRIHFSPRNAQRFVSAVDVLEGKVDPSYVNGQMVLIGVTGIGLGDLHNTSLGVSMPGSEIQAQLLESMLDDTLLIRPKWAPAAEAVLFFMLGALLIWAVPTWRPRNAALLAVACLALLVAGAYVAFRSLRLVLDPATPGVGLLLLFGALLVLTLAEATRQKKSLERVMQAERESAARMAGELETARRIQMAFLPDAGQFADDRRVDLAASMMPAREVGGDLYDFYRLDDRRIFFLVGDVAGKGVSASIFMAISKALYKSATLRAGGADVALLMSEANAEVSRDNPQMLFVTAFAGILDLDSGELVYCNAGHENPFLVDPIEAVVRRLDEGGGPPLCAVDAFAYRGARIRLRPGELLCVVTDGVTEAQSPTGELFGSQRMSDALLRAAHSAITAHDVVLALRTQVESFVAGAEPADDLTILVLRWQGPETRTNPGAPVTP